MKGILGIKPNNIDIYKQAFVHRSAVSSKQQGNERGPKSNERLEYLGDAILGAVMADILYERFPNANEGELTKKRAALVQRKTLDALATNLNISQLLVAQRNLKIVKGSHVAGNALEALFGAIYLDKGFKACKKFAYKLINEGYFDAILHPENSQNQKGKQNKNKQKSEDVTFTNVMQAKVDLLEWGQKKRLKITFDVPEKPSKDNRGAPIFECVVYVEKEKGGTGVGTNKKTAQANAAAKTLKMIKEGKFKDLQPSDPMHQGPKQSRKQRSAANAAAQKATAEQNENDNSADKNEA